MPEMMQLYAAAAVALCHARRRRLENALAAAMGRASCLRYFEFAAHDETPLPVQLRQDRGGKVFSEEIKIDAREGVLAWRQQHAVATLSGRIATA